MKTKELRSVFKELISQYQDLKAEVIVSEVLENSSVSESDIVTRNSSSFTRAYRRDIIKIDPIDPSNPRLRISLSRNGLYDRLPEGMFHNLLTASKKMTPSDRRKIQKKEQEDARSFFDPLENEFFHQKLEIEKNERALLNDFYNLKDRFLIDFWKLDSRIPSRYLLKLVKLLPSSYKISGDLEMSRMCLERILELPVAFNKTLKHRNKDKAKRSDVSRDLQEPMLGVDMVLDSEVIELLQPVIEVSLGPLSVERIHEFNNDYGMKKFMETFYSYFIPMEFDVETDYVVSEERTFSLQEDMSPVMGITTRI